MIGIFREGQTHSITVAVTPDDLAQYVRVSGDSAPVHTDVKFAEAAGFTGVVLHGGYLMALVSRLVGMEFPGPKAVLERMDIAFRNPCYVPCEIRLAATVRQISEAVASIIMDIVISNSSGTVLASGKTWHRILGVASPGNR